MSGYRLPTEAEWEYACRAGNTGHFGFGDDGVEKLERYAWFGGKSGPRPQLASLKAPNAFGLYDMHGNLSECCQDVFATYDQKIRIGGERSADRPDVLLVVSDIYGIGLLRSDHTGVHDFIRRDQSNFADLPAREIDYLRRHANRGAAWR